MGKKLQSLARNDIVSLATMLTYLQTMEEEKYLQMHKYSVWQGTNGRYCTHVKDEGGKRKLISKGTEEELRQAVIRHYKELDKSPSVQRCFDEWAKKKLDYGEIERQSYDKYVGSFKRFFEPIEDIPISDITENDLEDFIRATIHTQELTAKAWSDMRLVMTGIWKYAKKHGYTDISIKIFFGDLELSPKIFKKKPRVDSENVFNDLEVQKILKYIREKEATPVELGIALSFKTGLRAGEVVALRYSDMDSVRHVLSVNKTEIRYKGEHSTTYEIRGATKGKYGAREVYLTDDAIKIIDKLRDLSDKDELFSVHSSAFTNRLYRICDELGIPHRSMHKCRKTYASKLINAGVSDTLVAKQLGHTDVATTYRHYVFNDKSEESEREILTTVLTV